MGLEELQILIENGFMMGSLKMDKSMDLLDRSIQMVNFLIMIAEMVLLIKDFESYYE